MIKTNEKKLVEFALQVTAGQPMMPRSWSVDRDGKAFILPSIGGITLNISVGDAAFGWAGDHIEPGVSAAADQAKRLEHPNASVQRLANVGDPARVISGDAKGAKGVVIGHHGGSEHLIIDFPRVAKSKLSYDDKIMVTAKGMGLELTDYPDIKCWNLNPALLKKMKLARAKSGKLRVPVTTLVPPECMGSGVGSTNVSAGDYDVMTGDPEAVAKYRLDRLRFGDFVALLDHDNRFGRDHRKGAISIGVVVHSDCLLSGHGPGITTVLTAATDSIEPIVSSKANIADLLRIGKFRK